MSARVHDLKSWPQYFQLTSRRLKLFELRVNDRDYQADELVLLREFDPASRTYTGRSIVARITCVVPMAPLGIAGDYVGLGLEIQA